MPENLIEESIAMALLSAGTVTDIREKKVRLAPVIVGLLAGLVLSVLKKSFSVSYLAGFGTGACMLLISIVSRGAVGFGDGLVLLALAALLGGERTLADLLAGLLLSGFYALFLLLRRRAARNKELPFLPFLLLAHLLVLIGMQF